MTEEIKQALERFNEIEESSRSELSCVVKKMLEVAKIGGIIDRALWSGLKSKNPLIKMGCFGTLGCKYTTYLFAGYTIASVIDKYVF